MSSYRLTGRFHIVFCFFFFSDCLGTEGVSYWRTLPIPVMMEAENNTWFPEDWMAGAIKWWKANWIFRSIPFFICSPAEPSFKVLHLSHFFRICYYYWINRSQILLSEELKKKYHSTVSVIYPQWNLQTINASTPVTEHFSFT